MSDMTNSLKQPSPYAFEGVLTRRMLAFVIDYCIVLIMLIPAWVVMFFFTILTFGYGAVLYPLVFFVVAGLYFGLTLSSSRQATPGMQVMDLRMVRDDGAPIDFVTAVLHLVTFWILNSVLTPFVLLVGLFTERKRLFHDILLGTALERGRNMMAAMY